MLSCLLLWLRHSSQQLLCPANTPRSVVIHSLHYVPFVSHCTRSLRLGYCHSHNAAHVTTNSIRFSRKAHSTSFRSFIPSSLGKFAVHPLPLLCSPALSSGLRAVMLFASCLVGHRSTNRFQQPITHKQKITPALVRCSRSPQSRFTFLAAFLIARTALIRSSFALLAHTLPPARGLTSGKPLRSPWAARNPTKAIALPSLRKSE
jgi:hypothetical protein